MGRKGRGDGWEGENKGKDQVRGLEARYGFIMSPNMDSPVVIGMDLCRMGRGDKLVWERRGSKGFEEGLPGLSAIRGGVWCRGG